MQKSRILLVFGAYTTRDADSEFEGSITFLFACLPHLLRFVTGFEARSDMAVQLHVFLISQYQSGGRRS